MKLVLSPALDNNETAPAEHGISLKVWMLYEDASLCSQALSHLHHVVAKLEGTGQMLCASTRLDLLADPKLAQALTREALAADIVVVAARDCRSLPLTPNNWITLWHILAPERPTALRIELDAKEDQCGERWEASFQLSEMARLGHVVFYGRGGGASVAATENGLVHLLARRDGAARSALGREQPPLLPVVNDPAWDVAYAAHPPQSLASDLPFS